MSVFVTPPLVDDHLWPTLGPQVWDWILAACVYGPGDLRGRPLDGGPDATPAERAAFLGALAEFRAVVFRAYQVYPRAYPETITVDGEEKPHPNAGEPHPRAGRRRFKRLGVSWRKGTAKTEKGGWLAAAELSPSGPVRFGGWDAAGRPVGVAVNDPYIPLVAFTEEQTEELGFAVLKTIVEESDYLLDELDPWKTEVVRKGGDGKAAALASAPNSRDGARTTFQFFDETHRMILERLLASHQTMLANIPKRPIADPWTAEFTTAYEPGAGSVAEGTFEYAKKIAGGKLKDPSLFFFHRQATDDFDLEKAIEKSDEAGIRAAVEEASGPAAKWADLDYIVALALEPQTDVRYYDRVWLNRLVQGAGRVFNVKKADEFIVKRDPPKAGAPIVLGFDGSQVDDATGLVATDLMSGWQWVLGKWERPYLADGTPKPGWHVPEEEVDMAVAAAFARWKVWRMYADPWYWENWLREWQGRFGEKKVVEWHTNRAKPMAYAVKAYVAATKGDTGLPWSWDGDERFRAHLGHTFKQDTKLVDEEGHPLYVMRKARPDSPDKIDLAMCGCLSWEAYRDGVAAGANRVASRVLHAY